jgi:hypothetical protein
MARKKHKLPVSGVDPDFLAKQRQAMLRRHRYVLYLNDNEKAVIDSYCERFNTASGKSAIMRGMIMEMMMEELDINHPTLF